MATINATAYKEGISRIAGSESFLGMVFQYIYSLPSLVMQGDYFAILISLIAFYFLIILVHKISGLFLTVIKKTISLAVTVLSLLFVYTKFMNSLEMEGFSLKTIVIGVIGMAIVVLGTIISLYSLFRDTKKAVAQTTGKKVLEEEKEAKPQIDLNQLKEFKTFFSLDSLKNDKSLLSVLTFLVVAEFGVFSSVTISAPTVQMGISIFAIFIVLSFIFIRQSYISYNKGVMHITVTFVLGSVLAVVLGHYWAGIPFSTLFSLEVFTTPSIVALISGMALSLFAGSRS